MPPPGLPHLSLPLSPGAVRSTCLVSQQWESWPLPQQTPCFQARELAQARRGTQQTLPKELCQTEWTRLPSWTATLTSDLVYCSFSFAPAQVTSEAQSY